MTKSVLITINTSWNIVNFRASLVRALREAGYSVISASPPDAYSPRLTTMVDRALPLPMDNAGTSPANDLLLFWRYWRILKRERPSVVLAYTIKPNIYGTLAAWLCGVPTIVNVSGLGTFFLHNHWSMRIVRPLYRAALGRAACVFFQNEEDRELFIGLGLVRAAKARLIPGSGVDIAFFHPSHNHVSSSSVTRFVLIARLLLDKGIAEYVEAARIIKRRYPNTEFNLVGPLGVANKTAVSQTTLAQWIEEGAIHYLGETDDVRSVLAQQDCVVLPSYREGMSRVLLEAAAMGKPLIATDVAGCRQVVDTGKNGYLCKPRDVNDLARCIEQFLNAPHEDRARMGKYSRQKAEQEFDEQQVINAYLETLAGITT